MLNSENMGIELNDMLRKHRVTRKYGHEKDRWVNAWHKLMMSQINGSRGDPQRGNSMNPGQAKLGIKCTTKY